MVSRKNVKKTQTIGKPFAKGNAGRPKGALNKTTIAAQTLLDGEAEALTRKAVSLALKGNMAALRLCLERILAPRRERAVSVALPTIADTNELPRLTEAIIGAVGEGSLTPSEAAALSGLIAAHCKTLEIHELAARISALEKESR